MADAGAYRPVNAASILGYGEAQKLFVQSGAHGPVGKSHAALSGLPTPPQA